MKCAKVGDYATTHLKLKYIREFYFVTVNGMDLNGMEANAPGACHAMRAAVVAVSVAAGCH